MLLACVRSYLKSILRYEVLIVDVCDPDPLYSRDQLYVDPWLFFETKRVREQKSLGNSTPEDLKIVSSVHWRHTSRSAEVFTSSRPCPRTRQAMSV